jgi:hypothetical protein
VTFAPDISHVDIVPGMTQKWQPDPAILVCC